MISHSNSITYVQKCTRWQKWQIWRKSSTIDNVSKISDFGDLLPPYCFVLCPVGDCGNIIIFATFAKFASIANFYGPPHCFVLCLVGDCGNIVIFAILAKFASIANFYGPPSLLCALPCWRLRQYCHFCHICQIRHYVLFFAIFVVACISGHISEKLSQFFTGAIYKTSPSLKPLI